MKCITIIKNIFSHFVIFYYYIYNYNNKYSKSLIHEVTKFYATKKNCF
jgi:hypothetical protein